MRKKSTHKKQPHMSQMQPREELQKHLVEELQDLYNAENQLVKALPKLAEASNSMELRSAFEEHLDATKEHVNRLEEIFSELNEKPGGVKCKGMEGLVAEGEERMQEDIQNPAVKDISLIGAAQKAEHYEISGYGTARTLAALLGMDQVAQILQQTLEDEGDVDKKLTEISEGLLEQEGAMEEQESAVE